MHRALWPHEIGTSRRVGNHVSPCHSTQVKEHPKMRNRRHTLLWMKDLIEHMSRCHDQLEWASDGDTQSFLADAMIGDLNECQKLCEQLRSTRSPAPPAPGARRWPRRDRIDRASCSIGREPRETAPQAGTERRNSGKVLRANFAARLARRAAIIGRPPSTAFSRRNPRA